MSDPALLTLGCLVMFLAAAGGYVGMRTQFLRRVPVRRSVRRRMQRARLARSH